MSEEPQERDDDSEVRELGDDDLDEVSAGTNVVEMSPTNNHP